jgi:fibronectin-binding autotransporter adhesin
VSNVSTFSGGLVNSGRIIASNTGVSILTVSTFTGGVTNSGTILAGANGIGVGTASGGISTFSGGVTNSGTISVGGAGIVVLNISTFSGGFSNSGTISASPTGDSVFVSGISAFSGGIANSGTISAAAAGIGVSNISTFSGGIANSGTILAGGAGIAAIVVTSFSGDLANSGTISAGGSGIVVAGTSTFSGNITNSGTILAGGPGINVGTLTFGGISTFSGGVTNTGTISAGGAGIQFLSTPSVNVFNSGSITGGGGTAIKFDSGINTLTLGPGFAINGNVLGVGADVFQLGGTGTGAFNLSSLGTQYTGFSTFNVVGAIWIATGASNQNWTIAAGALQLGNGGTSGSITGNIADNGILAVNRSDTYVSSGTISGSGSFVQMGPGTTVLTASNSYTGGTTVAAGVLQLSGAGTLGAATGALAVAGGTLDLGATVQTTGPLTLSGGTIQNGALNASAFGVQAGTVSAALGGAGALTKSGGGIVTLSAANTYSGGTSLNAGTLKVSADNNLGAATGGLTFNGGTLQLGASFDLSSSRAITLNSGGGTVATNGFNTTIAQAISGTGGLTKAGPGTLTLAGVNAYTGATAITAGALALGAGGSVAASSGVNLAAAGVTFDISGGGDQTIKDLSGVGGTVSVGFRTLTFGTANSTSFAGSFIGGGGSIKQGSGTFTLTGDSSGFTGKTLLTDGTLAVGPDAAPTASLGGTVFVQSGATLSGLGTVGSVTNLGTVAPGGSIGTLTVNGNYTQSATGTLRIEVSPNAASQLRVLGTATLGGTLALVYDPGVYTARSFTFLSAASTVGSFATVNSSGVPSNLAQVTTFDPVTGQLVLASVAAVVPPTNDTVFTAASSIPVLNGQRANGIILDRLGNRQAGIADGQVAAAATAAPVQYAQAGGAASLSAVASALPAATEGAWFRGVGGFATVDGNSAAPGFSGSAGGFLAGFDRPVAENFYLGIAGGYQRGTVDEGSTANGAIDTARLALYGGTWWEGNLLTATAGYAHDSFSTSRSLTGIGTPTESHGGNEATAAAQWSRPLQLQSFGGGLAAVTPKAGVQFLHLSENGFAETGRVGSTSARPSTAPTASSPISPSPPHRNSSPMAARNSPPSCGSVTPAKPCPARG